LARWSASASRQYQLDWTPTLAPPGWRSFTNIFSSMTGTLNDAEVGARMTAVLDKLAKNFGAKLRS
jgi:hypothetical protein